MQNNEYNPFKDEEERRLKHDADSGDDGSSTEILQKEGAIDPGNEHHHADNITDSGSLKHDVDAGGDASGTAGPAPVQEDNDEPDVSGEDA